MSDQFVKDERVKLSGCGKLIKDLIAITKLV